MSQQHEELRIQAGLAARIEAELPALAAEIDEQLGDLAIPNHRLSGLLNSLAWHQRRPTAAIRVRALAEELYRLEIQAAFEREAQFYRFLRERLDTGQESDSLLRGLRVPDERREHWVATARFTRARAALQIVEVLMRSADLRREIMQDGGEIRWQ